MPIPIWAKHKLNTEARNIARDHLKAHARQMKIPFNQINWSLLYREASELIKQEPQYIDWAIISLQSAIDHSDQAVINANPNTQERNPMSPNVGNFVHDLVEMAKAMETLPQVEQSLREAQQSNRVQADIINSLHDDLEQSRTYAASLEQKVRSLEVERDDASFRVLEAEDKAASILNSARVAQAGLDAMIAKLDPPKPQPEPEPVQPPVSEAVHSLKPDWKQDQAETSLIKPQGQGEALPMTANSGETKLEQTSVISSATEDATLGASPPTQPPASQDQSEVNPTAPQIKDQSVGGASSITTENVQMHSLSSEPKPSGPYTGKRYIDVPYYVSRDEWLAGGGIEEDYRLIR